MLQNETFKLGRTYKTTNQSQTWFWLVNTRNRKANINPRRRVTYKLEECEMVLKDDKEIVGSCNDVILEILNNFYKDGQK